MACLQIPVMVASGPYTCAIQNHHAADQIYECPDVAQTECQGCVTLLPNTVKRSKITTKLSLIACLLVGRNETFAHLSCNTYFSAKFTHL